MIEGYHTIVHVAGEYKDGVQSCFFCGHILVDHRGVMIEQGQTLGTGFKMGACVGVTMKGDQVTNPKFKFVIERPFESDEHLCKLCHVVNDRKVQVYRQGEWCRVSSLFHVGVGELIRLFEPDGETLVLESRAIGTAYFNEQCAITIEVEARE